MTRSERIENGTAIVAMLLVAGSMSTASWAWMDNAALVALFAGLGWAYAVRTPEDRARARRGVWVIPVVTALMAAQWFYFAEPDERIRAALLGCGLVAAASALAWVRRRRQ
jgi:hypothetical protein